MSSVASSTSVLFKPIVGEGREARQRIVREFLQAHKLEALFQAILKGDSKCRLAVAENDESSPRGLFVYANQTSNQYAHLGLRDGVEIQFFSSIPEGNRAFYNAPASLMWGELKELARDLNPKSFYLTPQRIERLSMDFFKSIGFQTFTLDPSRSVILLGWSEPERGPKRRREEEEKRPAGDESAHKKSEIDSSRPVPVTLKKVYIHQIRNGAKTIEGRVNNGMFTRIQVGSVVRFFYMANAADDVHCRVTKVHRYTSFSEMVRTEGYRACIPDATSEAHAIGQYDAIPNYTAKAAQFGVLAFHLQVVEKRG